MLDEMRNILVIGKQVICVSLRIPTCRCKSCEEKIFQRQQLMRWTLDCRALAGMGEVIINLTLRTVTNPS